MNHLDSNHMSQAQLDYELGVSKNCLNANMTSSSNWTNATNMALPLNAGWDNKTVINTIIKYNYTMDRASTAPTMYLHCNRPSSGQTNCWTFDINGGLTEFNKYNIRGFNHNKIDVQTNNNTQVFQQFIQEVNSATTNTSANSTEIPIIYYHHVVINNNAFFDPLGSSTNVAAFEAEMRYLMENNFRIHTTKDLAYDSVNNFLYFKN
jgi:hypothetical protein